MNNNLGNNPALIEEYNESMAVADGSLKLYDWFIKEFAGYFAGYTEEKFGTIRIICKKYLLETNSELEKMHGDDYLMIHTPNKEGSFSSNSQINGIKFSRSLVQRIFVANGLDINFISDPNEKDSYYEELSVTAKNKKLQDLGFSF